MTQMTSKHLKQIFNDGALKARFSALMYLIHHKIPIDKISLQLILKYPIAHIPMVHMKNEGSFLSRPWMTSAEWMWYKPGALTHVYEIEGPF